MDISERIAGLSPTKLALLVEKIRAKTDGIEFLSADPIAVTGIGCHFPGGIASPQAFWQLLSAGTDAITEIPKSRWDIDAYYNPDPDAPGKMYCKYGGFIHDVEQFENEFFSISPREAQQLDPQQRILLEVCWQALENAGEAPDKLLETQTGVFIGVTTSDYLRLIHSQGDENIGTYTATGNSLNAISGRLSYFLGLQGPSMIIDTACSSSLVAVHMACQSLRAHESEMTVVGGVNLILSPEGHIATSKARMLAPDGRCKTFDSRADGYVRGEGCGVLVLKRLYDALENKDNILAIIRGSAVNQDGASSGLTVPNGVSQKRLLKSALKNAGVKPDQVSYIEAHGTGTALGDPIEIEALANVYCKNRSSSDPLLVGSTKTNIGHLESAAGIAGLIKLILSLHNKQIPPHLHFQKPNPHIPWEKTHIKVPTEATAWPQERKIGGVSSFGFSGTNSHVIVEQYISEAKNVSNAHPQILVLSTKTEGALKQLIQKYKDFLSHTEASLPHICYTAGIGRSHFSYRCAILAKDKEQAIKQLDAFTPIEKNKNNKVAFLFTGQGSQYAHMGYELYKNNVIFRKVIDQCEQIISPYLQKPLLSVLYEEEHSDLLNQTAYTQPAIFAIECALAELWKSWGITPSVVMGHSVGEYAAAYVAGVFSLEDGLKLIAKRAQLMQQLPQNGSMVSVAASLEIVKDVISLYLDKVSIAAVNGPKATVISGEKETIALIVQKLEENNIKNTVLNVSHAFHSPLMKPIIEEFKQFVTSVDLKVPGINLVSNLTGTFVKEDICTVSYWADHILSPVLFMPSIEFLHSQGYKNFLEIGPTPVLSAMGRSCLGRQPVNWLPSLRKGKNDGQQLLKSLSTLYLHGANIHWQQFYNNATQKIVLPNYPFKGKKYWIKSVKKHKEKEGTHPVLGNKILSPLKEIIFQREYQVDSPIIKDHILHDTLVVPGSYYVSLMLLAGKTEIGGKTFLVEKAEFQKPQILLEGKHRELQLVVTPQALGKFEWKVFSILHSENSSWDLHASGFLSTLGENPLEKIDIEQIKGKCSQEMSGSEFYSQMLTRKFQLGPDFQWIEHIWFSQTEALCKMRLAQATGHTFPIHPGLLDSCFQSVGATLEQISAFETTYVPVHVEKFYIYQSLDSLYWSYVTLTSQISNEVLIANLKLYDKEGHLLGEIKGLHIKKAKRKALLGYQKQEFINWLYQTEWLPQDSVNEETQPLGFWVIISQDQQVANQLAAAMVEDVKNISIVSEFSSREEYDKIWQQYEQCQGVLYIPISYEQATDSQNNCQNALHLVQSMAQFPYSSKPRLCIVTQGAQVIATEAPNLSYAPLWAMAKVIAIEFPELQSIRIDLDPQRPIVEQYKYIIAEIQSTIGEDQVAYRNQQRYLPRLKRIPHSTQLDLNEAFALQINSRGTLDNLQLAATTRSKPGAEEVEIEVYATGLNFRDVLNALGMMPGDIEYPLGGECAGKIVALGENVNDFAIGDEVLAIFAPGCFSKYVLASSKLLIHKPKEISFEDAVTVPAVFLTANYALYNLANIKEGQKVLIHAGAGGVGQAAIQLAQQNKAEIFATAGSPEKRAFLKAQGVEHVMDSRSLGFAKQIKELTQDQGIDIVVNSLSKEFVKESISVLKPSGVFIEIGKMGILNQEEITDLANNISYHVFDIVDLFVNQSGLTKDIINKVIKNIQAKKLSTLPKTVFHIENHSQAFRYMAQAKHIGKIVVNFKEKSIAKEGTYLVTGALGGLGLSIVNWLVAKKVKNIVLWGRNKKENILKQIENQETNIVFQQVDVCDKKQVKQTLEQISQDMPPVRGVIHTAGVLEDGMLLQQQWQNFQKPLKPKIEGSWNLHIATQNCPLDFFVLYSSTASLLGTPGQSNYAAANAFLDMLAHYRRSQGLPATSINWGPWLGEGMASKLSKSQWPGISFIPIEKGLQTLEHIIKKDMVQPSVLFIDWKEFFYGANFQSNPFLANFAQPQQKAIPKDDIVEVLRELIPAKRKEHLHKYIEKIAIAILDLGEFYTIDPHKPLQEIGLDSLMAVEMKNSLEMRLAKSLPATMLFNYPTLDTIVDYLGKDVLQLTFEDISEPLEQENKEMEEVEQMSEDEAMALLQAKLKNLEEEDEDEG